MKGNTDEQSQVLHLRVAPIPALVILIGFYVAGVSYAQHSHTMPGNAMQQTKETKPANEDASLQGIYSQRVPAIQETVRRAIQHLEAGRHQEALNEMRQAQTSLVALHQALGQQVAPQFIIEAEVQVRPFGWEGLASLLGRAAGQSLHERTRAVIQTVAPTDRNRQRDDMTILALQSEPAGNATRV